MTKPSRVRWIVLMSCGVVMGVAGAALADSHNKDGAPAATKGAASQDAMMAEMMKLSMPGPQHEWLKKSEGRWNATVKLWAGPGEPTVTEGTSEQRLILGGRYLEQRFNGSMMGQPFEGYGLLGYDNRKKTYTSFWVDNTSTEMMNNSGAYDEATKTITMKTKMPGMDGKLVDARTVTKIVDDNTQVFSIYSKMDGKEMMVMEITYKRAQ